MSHALVRAAAVALVCAAATSAQRTWIVDAAGGAGVDYRNLPPAVAASAAGDTILVRPGNYTPFSTDKGIRVLGSTGTVVGGMFAGPIVVHDVPADEVFVMERCSSLTTLAWGRVELRDNAGSIHLERSDAAGSIVVEDCAHVTLANLKLGSIRVTDSVITMAGISAIGLGSVAYPIPTLDATRSTVSLSVSEIRGPDYRGGIGPFDVLNGPAAHLDASRLVISAGSALHAGDDRHFGVAVSGIVATASEIVLDPAAVVTGRLGAPPIVSDRPVTTRQIPALLAEGDGPGGLLAIGLWAPPFTPALVAISAPRAPVEVSPFGDLALDARSLVVVTGAAVPASGLAILHVPVPNLAVVRGTPITAQALVAFATGVHLSGPATIVLH